MRKGNKEANRVINRLLEDTRRSVYRDLLTSVETSESLEKVPWVTKLPLRSEKRLKVDAYFIVRYSIDSNHYC